jgi:hypothetical protein
MEQMLNACRYSEFIIYRERVYVPVLSHVFYLGKWLVQLYFENI